MLSRPSFIAAAIGLFLALSVPASAQEGRPNVALTGGLGNVLGGLGLGLEYYLAGSRLSAAAGMGYWPDGAGCNGTLSGAGALRGFTNGRRHRAFLELSYSLVAVSCILFFSEEIERHYGPGVSLGYRYTGSDGFTFTAGGGVADVPGESYGSELIILLGLGYTWRR
jgi:hypothetical protein